MTNVASGVIRPGFYPRSFSGKKLAVALAAAALVSMA